METSNKHRRLMALLSKHNISEKERHNLVHAWTGGRTSSSRGLTDDELTDLVWKFENDFSFRANPRLAAEAITLVQLKEKRSIVLAIAQRCGLHTGTDFKQFNSFMENRSILKKRLSKYTLDELDGLIKQMHALEANYARSAEKAFNKAWHHRYGIPEVEDN